MYFKPRYRNAVWATSIAIGLLIIVSPILTKTYWPQRPYLIPLDIKVNNTMMLGFIIMLVFPAFVEVNNIGWKKAIDKNVPRLLMDISEAVKSGVTLPEAIEKASKRDYGPISKEMQHSVAMLMMGSTWAEAMNSLAKRLNRPSATRLSAILIEAHETGGKLTDMLNTSVDLLTSLEEFKEEQRTNAKPYMSVVYMATLIFLLITFVMIKQLFTPLCLSASTAGSTLTSGILDIKYYCSVLYWAAAIESLFGGLIAGKIGDGFMAGGIKHSLILLLITFVVFNVMEVI